MSFANHTQSNRLKLSTDLDTFKTIYNFYGFDKNSGGTIYHLNRISWTRNSDIVVAKEFTAFDLFLTDKILFCFVFLRI